MSTQSLPVKRTWRSRIALGFRKTFRRYQVPPEMEDIETDGMTDLGIVDGFQLMIISMVATALTGIAAVYILSFPDGLAGMIGTLLAEQCKANGMCDFQVLYPAFGLAIIILTHFFIGFSAMVFSWVRDDQGEELRILNRKLNLIYQALAQKEEEE